MALADWEILLGEGLGLGSQYVVSGNKALTQAFNKGVVHMVHTGTYADAPKNVRIDTWMTKTDVEGGTVGFFIGLIARKQDNEDTYFYIYLTVQIYYDESLSVADIRAGKYINGAQYEEYSEDITESFRNEIGGYWNAGKWRFVRLEGYESGGKFNMSIFMTPDISSPDPANPPEDQLRVLGSVSLDIPTELTGGGACGLLVGGYNVYNASGGEPYYDYTQIYY